MEINVSESGDMTVSELGTAFDPEIGAEVPVSTTRTMAAIQAKKHLPMFRDYMSPEQIALVEAAA